MSLKIGFELEFGHQLVDEEDWTSREEYHLLKYALRKELGFRFETGDASNSYRNWYIYDDGPYGCELVSPVMDYERGIAQLRRLFDWMSSTDAMTAEGTGLHVNLSLSPTRMKKIDRAKLVLLMDEMKWLKAFGREDNDYCEPYCNYFPEIHHYEEDRLGIWEFGELVKNNVRSNADKYRTANFKLNERTPWVEFRVMGGEDYHKKTDLVIEATDHFAKSLKPACYVSKDRATYRDKLVELQKSVGVF